MQIFEQKNDMPNDYTGIAYFKDKKFKGWYKNGLLHRLDGPAKITDDGCWYWKYLGELHCVTGPAIYQTDREGRQRNGVAKGSVVNVKGGWFIYCLEGVTISVDDWIKDPYVIAAKLKQIENT